jgi:tetratricopeptide (TPR) repeat protein
VQALHRTELADAQLLLKRSRQGPFPLAPETERAQWASAGPGALDATYHHRIEVLLSQAFSSGRAVRWGGGDAEDLQGRWSALTLAFPLHRLAPEAIAAQPPLRLDALIPAHYRELGDPWTGRWLAEYLNFVGTWAVHQERVRLALEAFERAHRFWPAYSRPLVNLGVLTARTGNFEGALSLVESALDRDPLNVTARLNQGRYLCVLGRAEEAREALGTAVRLDPRDPAIASVEALFQQLGCAPAVGEADR